LAFQWRVGRGRNKFNVPGPNTTGPETWQRYNRVHLNTVENLVVRLPLLWICGSYLHPYVAAPLGLVFVVARALYSRAYIADPATRGRGAWLTGISLYLLAFTSLIGLALHAF
jgi:glutathione S-transferase